MAQSINKPRGTLDFYGLNKQVLDELIESLDNEAVLYGVKPIEIPIFEESKLFKRGVGESTDIVNKETFDLDGKGGHEYTLRPEFTAGINRAVIENKLYASPDLPLKFYYSGPVFRYERPQVGRYRQFTQWGVEFIDNKIDIISTISCMSLLFNQAKKILGIEPVFKINYLGSFTSRENYKLALKEYFKSLIQDMCGDCQRRYEQNPLRILDCKVEEDRKIIEKAPLISDYLSEEDKSEYQAITDALDALGIPYTKDDKLVRGLDYYTGIVFELYNSDKLEVGAIGAGGKYGHLMLDLGGPDYEGIGYSFGVERLVLSLVNDVADKSYLDYFLVVLDDDKTTDALKVSDYLIKSGLKVSFASRGKALTGALKMGDRLHSLKTIIFDERGYHYKDMVTRDQKDYTELTDLVKMLGKEE